MTRKEQRQHRIDAYDWLRPAMFYWRSKGLLLREIAQRLNDGGHRTVTGGPFRTYHISVRLRRPMW
jgi:hypothetical protein